jgi:hypothetical protein
MHMREHAQEQAHERANTKTKVTGEKGKKGYDKPFNEHGDWTLELFQDAGHRFTVKMASAEEQGQTFFASVWRAPAYSSGVKTGPLCTRQTRI